MDIRLLPATGYCDNSAMNADAWISVYSSILRKKMEWVNIEEYSHHFHFPKCENISFHLQSLFPV